MLFFGLDSASKIAFGFLLGFFPITLAVLAGIRQVSPQLVTVARAFGARPLTTFRKVMIPAMLFTLVGGLRTGLALTVIGVIVGEMLSSFAGLGYMISHARETLDAPNVYFGIVLGLLLAGGTNYAMTVAEHRLARWRT
jgi:ABC-type nitrate/sulfonate/bicarbonate transport system permease component